MAMSGLNKFATGLSLAWGAATGGIAGAVAAKLLPNNTGFGNRTLAYGASTVATFALLYTGTFGPMLAFGGHLQSAVIGAGVSFALADVVPFFENLVQRDKSKSADYLR